MTGASKAKWGLDSCASGEDKCDFEVVGKLKPSLKYDYCNSKYIEDTIKYKCVDSDGAESEETTITTKTISYQECVDLTNYRIGIGCFWGVSLLVSGYGAVFTFLNKSNKVIKASSPFFLYLLVLGAWCALAGVGLQIFPEEETDEACFIAPVLINTGYSLMISSLTSKTWRLMKIFNNPKLAV